jgi:hypothetical protein
VPQFLVSSCDVCYTDWPTDCPGCFSAVTLHCIQLNLLSLESQSSVNGHCTEVDESGLLYNTDILKIRIIVSYHCNSNLRAHILKYRTRTPFSWLKACLPAFLKQI